MKMLMTSWHGQNNCRDLYALDASLPAHQRVREAASGVAVLLSTGSIQPGPGQQRSLAAVRQYLRSQQGQPFFYGQRALRVPSATAFLVDRSHIITAGHYLAALEVGSLSAVFGFQAAGQWRNEPIGPNDPVAPYLFDQDAIAGFRNWCTARLRPARWATWHCCA